MWRNLGKPQIHQHQSAMLPKVVLPTCSQCIVSRTEHICHEQVALIAPFCDCQLHFTGFHILKDDGFGYICVPDKDKLIRFVDQRTLDIDALQGMWQYSILLNSPAIHV